MLKILNLRKRKRKRSRGERGRPQGEERSQPKELPSNREKNKWLLYNKTEARK